MRFDRRELIDLLIAWAGVAFIFSLAANGLQLNDRTAFVVLLSITGAGLGVVVHEIAHKIVADRMGYATRFIADTRNLLIGAAFALIGWIVLAPGGVRIAPAPRPAQGALIAFAGPASNMLIAVTVGSFVPLIGLVNAYLAAFNLLPVPGFDGHAIWTHDKKRSIVALIAAGLILLTFLI